MMIHLKFRSPLRRRQLTEQPNNIDGFKLADFIRYRRSTLGMIYARIVVFTITGTNFGCLRVVIRWMFKVAEGPVLSVGDITNNSDSAHRSDVT